MSCSNCFLTGTCLALLVSVVITPVAAAAPATQAAPSTLPATQPVSSVKGTVTAEGEIPLAEMVVYLESADAARPMPKPPQAIKVSQKGAQFAPRLVVVMVGQAVEFLNDEDRLIEHNVFSNSPAKRFDLGLYRPGDSKKVVFDKAGPVFLYCSIHRYMDGVVYVSPTPYTSRVDDKGHYSIDNVPPGTWTVKTWQRRRRFLEKTIPVTVEVNKPVTIDLPLEKKK